VLILPVKESAVGMASYHQQFAKHLRQIRIFRTGAQKNIDRNCDVLPIEYAITITFSMLIGKVAGYCQL
jgi:hypothetical protein